MLLVAAALSLCTFRAAHAVALTLYIWDDYISDEVLTAFQKQTGITIRQVPYDSEKTRDEIVASSRGREFDLVLFDSVGARVFGRSRQLLAFGKDEVPNLTHIDPQWRESCGTFGLPYFYGTIGVVYDTTRYNEAPDSWSALLQPARDHWGNVVMMQDMVDTLAPALLYLGYSINTGNRDELKAAYNLLEKQVPAVLNYNYSLSTIKTPGMAGKMDIALAYSGDQYVLNEASGTEKWAYIVPREGTALWIDCLSVTSWSRHRKEALRFLNFMGDPKNAAINAVEVRSALPMREAKAYMSAEDAADPELFPPREVVEKGQRYEILSGDNLRLRRRILAAILKRHEAQ